MTEPITSRERFTNLRQLPINLQLDGFKASILGWGFYEPEWWRNYLHEHSFFEVCYVWQGQGQFRINNEIYAVQKGMVFIAKPGEPHEIISSEDDPMGIYFWSYTLVPPSIQSKPSDMNILLQTFLTSRSWTSEKPELQYILDRLTTEIVNRQPGYVQIINMLITQLIVETARSVTVIPSEQQINTTEDHDPTGLLVADMVRYLQDNYSRPITIRDVAAQVHLSNRHTNRLFNRVMGTSIHNYLTRFRLKVASQLLLDQDLSVTETAYACGYRDVRHFITRFKKHTGITPSAFRKQGGTRFLQSM